MVGLSASPKEPKNPKEEHPATALRELRAFVFATYEKHGIDQAFGILKAKNQPRTVQAAVSAELVFYDKFRKEFQLEPLLDAGSKADFTGLKPRSRSMTNFDVTTNLSYKDIDLYVDCVKSRGKTYEIALVDLKSEEVTFFPLRFPICRQCNKFSHYVLYLLPSSTTTYSIAHISDQQDIIQFCPHCDEVSEIDTYDYLIHSIAATQESMAMDEEPQSEITKAVNESATTTERFFRNLSQLILSGIAENEEVQGYRGELIERHGKLMWKHPLARSLPETMDYHYAPWSDEFRETI